MAWFKPKSLLDNTYEIGITLKGLHGVLELVAGTLLLFISPHTITKISNILTSKELSEDPNDFIATRILRYSHELTLGHNKFAIAFLLTHGLVRVVLVASLLRNKPWAYPFAMVTLSLFMAYQLYTLVVHATLGMAILTIIDIFIIWLVWQEWKKQKAI
jgi:uncharacterized membrane protein